MENENKKLYAVRGSLAIKILAGLLFVASCAAAVFGFIGVLFLANDRTYLTEEPASFYESSFCEMVARNLGSRAYYMLESYPPDIEAAAMKIASPDFEFAAERSNLLFVMRYYDHKADELLGTVQNCDGEPVAGFFENSFWYGDGKDEWRVEMDLYVRYPLLDNGDGFMTASILHDFVAANRVAIVAWFAASLLLAIALFVFLLSGAGRRRGLEGVHLNWFDRIPLDLLAFIIGSGCLLLLFVSVDVAENAYYYYYNFSYSSYEYYVRTVMFALGISAFASLAISLLMTFASRVKAGAWWRNTLIHRIIYRCFIRLLRAIPLVWRSALIFCAAAFINLVLAVFAADSFHYTAGFVLLLLLFDLALLAAVVGIALQMRRLKEGGEALARGNLAHTVDTGKMLWEFRRHGENLNSISEGMHAAVEERMKSERMKTELITNVSHDIKTPLTSIINYVDLLKKEGLEDKSAEYVEVLDRQSQRLKKLTEDLVEASKASSGALSVELSDTDIGELLQQAIGEYTERLKSAGVETVLTAPETAVRVKADGKLLWRVFDNLMSNICKYAMEGTRAYFSLDEDAARVYVMVRNISSAPLNISADELQERFVRGDRSRSTDGSGLGLSISRSLVELMGGTFSIYLDGDLFKVIISLQK